MPEDVVRAALTSFPMDADAGVLAALEAGTAVRVDNPGRPALALSQYAEAERALSEALRRRAAEGRLRIVCAEAPIEPAADEAVLPHAERWDVLTAADAVARVPADRVLVLHGDPGLPWSMGPGAFFADTVAASPVLPEALAWTDDPRPESLQSLDAALRGGRLVDPAPGDDAVVVLAADDDVSLAERAVRAAADVLPDRYELATDELVVLAPLHRGVAGARALAQALDEHAGADAPEVMVVHEAIASTWPCVVLVLPSQSAGVLSRPLLVGAVSRAEKHLVVLNAAGHVVMSAAAQVGHRERWTGLRALLRAP